MKTIELPSQAESIKEFKENEEANVQAKDEILISQEEKPEVVNEDDTDEYFTENEVALVKFEKRDPNSLKRMTSGKFEGFKKVKMSE